MKKDNNRRGFLKSSITASLSLALPGALFQQAQASVSAGSAEGNASNFFSGAAESFLAVPIEGSTDGMKAALKNNPPAAGKRVGIIGLDTSHSIAFTKALNAVKPDPVFMGYKVVAAYPYGSKTIKSSADRIPGYIKQMEEMGISMSNSIADLLEQVDVVLLETNDGRLHLEQALLVLEAKKPLFIDKPIAASYADAKKIFDKASSLGVPVFSSSSLRYITGAEAIVAGNFGKVLGAETYSPATIEPTHPDLYWYGIHGIETLFTMMGTGCVSVQRIHTKETDVVIGTWKDGRIGTFRGTRNGKPSFGGTVFTEKGVQVLGEFKGYNPLLEKITQFFATGVAPVKPEETLQICAFIEAADKSKKKKGAVVKLNG
jgi:predicted dehydrogenase